MSEAKTATAWDRISVVVVTHNSAAVIEACLQRVTAARAVYLVDNASDDDTVAIAQRVLPDLHVIRNKVGHGFGNASNQGLECVTTEFALHINPDALVEGGCAEALVEAADMYPSSGVFGPKIIDPDGHVDRSYDVSLHRREGMSKNRSTEAFPQGPCCTWFLSGALLFYRMDALRAVGMFDPAIFLYFEDDDISARFAGAGYAPLFVPTAVSTHLGGGSIRPSLAKHWEKFYHFSWSRLYYEAKYKGRCKAAKLAWTAIFRALGKFLGHLVTLNGKKAVSDLARVVGSMAYLLRVPVSKTTNRARPICRSN